MKKLLKNDGVQTFLASLLCIILGMLIGYIVLLFINPAGAGKAIMDIMRNFFNFSNPLMQLKRFGNTVAKTMPLLLCSLSILFSYKVGLFNIGVAGQYCIGVCASLYAALAWHWNWFFCMTFAIVAGAFAGMLVGLLKSLFNVNEVISGIMLNWIILYFTNMTLNKVKEVASPYTLYIDQANPSAFLPNAGLDKLFNNNQYITIAVPIALVVTIAVYVVLNKTKLGYELRATGLNAKAAKYCGMAEKKNMILSLVISGALAGLGASLLYQTGYMRWECTSASVPAMGFNGIATAFLGGLNPIGAIFSSYFIQHITDGGSYVDKSMYCSQISDLISSIIIYLCGFVFFMKYAFNKVLNKKKEPVNNANAKTDKGGEN